MGGAKSKLVMSTHHQSLVYSPPTDGAGVVVQLASSEASSQSLNPSQTRMFMMHLLSDLQKNWLVSQPPPAAKEGGGEKEGEKQEEEKKSRRWMLGENGMK